MLLFETPSHLYMLCHSVLKSHTYDQVTCHQLLWFLLLLFVLFEGFSLFFIVVYLIISTFYHILANLRSDCSDLKTLP